MYDYTSNNWNYENNNKILKKYLETIPGKRSKFSLQDSCTRSTGSPHLEARTLGITVGSRIEVPGRKFL
jgi:ribosomal protein L13E